MEKLKSQLKETFASVFSMYLKAANFHWNVEGPDFYQYHQLFEQIYNDVYGSLDPLAEQLRAIGTYVPATLARVSELTTVEDVKGVLPAQEMITSLHDTNDLVVASLNKSFAEADKNNNQALMNFLADRLDQHAKWGWFLRSSTKRGTE